MFAFLAVPVPAWIGLGTLAGLLLGVWLTRALARSRAHRRMRRLRRMGQRGEARAHKLLRKNGYHVVEWQVAAQSVALIDGVAHAFPVRADALATRKGKRFVVEIKGGHEAARVANRTTRRQLLEYAVTFETSGVLLVDAARGAVRLVEFPALDGLASA